MLDIAQLFRLDDQVVVVTGASSGLGARFARVVDAAGAHVVLVARRGDALKELAGELRSATVVVTDITAPDASELVIGHALECFGSVDVLVNNAGISKPAPAMREAADDFRRVVEVNLVAPFLLAQRAACAMVD